MLSRCSKAQSGDFIREKEYIDLYQKDPLPWQYITVALDRKSLEVLHEYSNHAEELREPGQKWFFKYQQKTATFKPSAGVVAIPIYNV